MRTRGMVLIVVLVLIALAGMIVLTLLYRATGQAAASAAAGGGEQAHAAAMSGIQRAMMTLKAGSSDPSQWLDNPDLFCNQLVYDDGANRWYFSVYADNGADRSTVRYGLEDEAGKININTADEATLLALPGMTSELAACLLDFRDSDGNVRDGGAEQDSYNQLAYPYTIKNGPLTTVEELLLVKGFTGAVVYGEDANFNGVLDANENDGEARFPPDNGDGQLNVGLRGLTTVLSYEKDVTAAGAQRLNINGNLSALGRLGLPAQTVQFIQLYRAEGNLFRHPSELLNMRYQLKSDHDNPGSAAGGRPRRGRGSGTASPQDQTPPQSDSPDGSTAVQPDGQASGLSQTQPGEGFKAGAWIESGVGGEQLDKVLDLLTTAASVGQAGPVRFGLVNVNTAPPEVLAAVLGPDLADKAQSIVDARASIQTETATTVAWLYTQEVLDAETFKKVAPKLTTRSGQFRVRCVGFGSPSGRFRVLEAIIDLAGEAPRIAYLRDITRLGMPFAPQVDQEQAK